MLRAAVRSSALATLSRCGSVKSRGFTLVELITVLLILSSLSWLALRALSPSHSAFYGLKSDLQNLISQAQFSSFASSGYDRSDHNAPDLSVYLRLSQSGDALNAEIVQGAQVIHRYQRILASGEQADLKIDVNETSLNQEALSLGWYGGEFIQSGTPFIEIAISDNHYYCGDLLGFAELRSGRCL